MLHSSYRPHPPQGVSALLTRMVLRHKAALLGGRVRLLICGKALPLDPEEARPLEAALDRNIEAAVLLHRTLPCCS